MFQFVREALSICIKKIKGLVERDDNVFNDVDVVGNKCREEFHDVDNEQEPEIVIVYEKLREYPLKR